MPRNPRIAANRDPRFFDLGLCGPERRDLAGKPELCGRFHTLREVLEFYVQRDTNPVRWYPRGRNGRVHKFDDLPAKYRDNLETDVPFAPLPGGRPRLTAREIDDVIAFLKTLSDGWQAEAAAAR